MSNIKNLEDIDNKISYLCKKLHTSRPEQYIYTYIKEIFPTAVRSKKFEWLLWNAEFDIFIPELNLAIEYDGFHWHNEKVGLSDLEKNELAKENGITLFRIREVGLEETNCDYYVYDYKKLYDNIDKPINAIIEFINTIYNKDIKKVDNIDWMYIKEKTLDNLKEQNREMSIIGLWEEVEKYWDYEHNKEDKPEDIRKTSKKVFYAICPYCNKQVQFMPRLSYHCYGKYSFTPHICKELDNYCISLVDKKCKSGKFELDMDNLDDRRLKDWLIRIVTAREIYTTIKDLKTLSVIEKKIGFKIDWQNLYEKKFADYYDLKRTIDRDF